MIVDDFDTNFYTVGVIEVPIFLPRRRRRARRNILKNLRALRLLRGKKIGTSFALTRMS